MPVRYIQISIYIYICTPCTVDGHRLAPGGFSLFIQLIHPTIPSGAGFCPAASAEHKQATWVCVNMGPQFMLQHLTPRLIEVSKCKHLQPGTCSPPRDQEKEASIGFAKLGTSSQEMRSLMWPWIKSRTPSEHFDPH